MASLSINARRTLATMGTELSAEFNIFEPDDVLLDYMRERNPGAAIMPTMPDADAAYADRRTIDLDGIEPLVALPDAVVNKSVGISEVAGRRIDQAFIGSCANGTLDDLAVAARVVRGRKVAKGTRFIVTPGTQAIYVAALKAGYIETLLDAGAVVTPATCGACWGGHMGALGPNEICITASTRNFKGRMGDPSARIYMASPATVAASALAGAIAVAASSSRETWPKGTQHERQQQRIARAQGLEVRRQHQHRSDAARAVPDSQPGGAGDGGVHRTTGRSSCARCSRATRSSADSTTAWARRVPPRVRCAIAASAFCSPRRSTGCSFATRSISGSWRWSAPACRRRSRRAIRRNCRLPTGLRAIRGPGQVLAVTPVPEMLLSLMTGGGILPVMEKQGLIAAAVRA